MDSIRIFDPAIAGILRFEPSDILRNIDDQLEYVEGIFTSDAGVSDWAHLDFLRGVPLILSLFDDSGEWKADYFLSP